MTLMEDILDCCCGLDIHKDTIVACLLKGSLNEKPTSEIRTFSTLIPDLNLLKEWLIDEDCRYVAMESTGIYWKPIYEILEFAFEGNIKLVVANARHIKNVPGKKTDKRDAEWIAELFRAGLLNSSFIPSKEVRELRDVVRYRKSIIRDITSQKNRIEKFLQSSGFRLSTFISDIFGASGSNVLNHLAKYGKISLEELDKCLKTQTRKKINEIMVAINSELNSHQRTLLSMMLEHLNDLKSNLKEVESVINSRLIEFESAVKIIDSIPCIDVVAAASVIAEIGTDMTKFKTSEHICSWAGLSPGNNESAGKKKRVKTNHGNPYIKSILCEVAWCIARHRDSYLSTWYWKIKQRKGAKKSIIALARKLLVIIYTMLKNGELYDESNFQIRKMDIENKKVAKMVYELSKRGYKLATV